MFYAEQREAIMKIIKELCTWKGIEIIEGEMAIDHVHLLLSIPPKFSISGVMGYLKGKSSLMLYQNLDRQSFSTDAENFGVVATMWTRLARIPR